jgi:hypothetical protein
MGAVKKDVGGIVGTGLYVCFSVLTTNKDWCLVVQIYFPNFQVISTVYFKKSCWHRILLHTTSKITIRTILSVLSIPNYSLTPTVSFK